MKCWVLLYGIILSYMVIICSALDSNAMEQSEHQNGSKEESLLSTDKKEWQYYSKIGGNSSIKNDTGITELVAKVCLIAKDAMKLTTKEEKTKHLSDIEEKLRASTQIHEDDRDAYVDLIMQNIRLMVEKFDTSFCQKTDSPSEFMEYINSKVMKSRKSKKHKPKEDKSTSKKKIELAKQVEGKIEHLVNKALENATNEEEKKQILAKVIAKVTDAFKNKEDLKDFVKASLDRALKRAGIGDRDSSNKYRRRAMDDTLNVEERYNKPLFIQKKDTAEETTESIFILTTRRSCDVIKSDACKRLKQLNEFECKYDNRVLPLKLVCDGSIDCADGSDEKNCERQAAQRLTNSSEFIGYLKINRECFEEIHANSALSQRGALLSGVLKTQLDFIQKYTINNQDPNYMPNMKYRDAVEDLSKELLLITQTFNLALTGALCMDTLVEAVEQLKKWKPNWDSKKGKQMKISPKACSCNGKLCSSRNCTDICKRICYQKYTLGQFSCKAVSNDGSIPLSEVCDGKFDCVDESDELGCVSGARSDAVNLYSDLMKFIELKILYKEFKPIWNQLKIIINLIGQIQKQSVSPNIDLHKFRTVRNACFNMLVSAFIDILDSSRNIDEGEDAYEFFLSVNEKLVNALKRSHTGNDRMISDNQCFCRGLQCALTDCSTHCRVHCSVKPALTTYACGNIMVRNNTHVNIEQICNDKPDCPNGEDERDCQTTEICRAHHLKVLRHNIEKLKYTEDEGTVFGEVFKAWKAKMSSNLFIAEKSSRITKNDLITQIRTILYDLVNVYVTMRAERKVLNTESDKKIFGKFENISQVIIETMKLCRK